MPRLTRRDFISTSTLAVAGAVLARQRSAPTAGIGYAAITWNGNDAQAIDDIAALGYPGIQLRSNILTRFGDDPAGLRDLLERRRLAFVAFSSGAASIDPAREARTIDEHGSHATFLRAAGGRFLQVTDERPAGRAVTADDCTRLGGLLTRIGRETSAIGIPLAYHPHMGTIGETPARADAVLAASDPRYVKLLLDVAHYQQGGGDPVAAIRRYRDRLALLHIKDLESPLPGSNDARSYRFVELGRGTVDVRGVFAALDEVGFAGWSVVELDAVVAPGRTPKESAQISLDYLRGIGRAPAGRPA